MNRQIDEAGARTRYDVASGVTKCVGLRCLECRSIEVMFYCALAARKRDALTQYNIRPVRRAGVCAIVSEVERVQRRPVLECEDPAELPIVHELRNQTAIPLDTRQAVD